MVAWLVSYVSDPYRLVFVIAIALVFWWSWPRKEDDDIHGERIASEIERQWLKKGKDQKPLARLDGLSRWTNKLPR